MLSREHIHTRSWNGHRRIVTMKMSKQSGDSDSFISGGSIVAPAMALSRTALNIPIIKHPWAFGFDLGAPAWVQIKPGRNWHYSSRSPRMPPRVHPLPYERHKRTFPVDLFSALSFHWHSRSTILSQPLNQVLPMTLTIRRGCHKLWYQTMKLHSRKWWLS